MAPLLLALLACADKDAAPAAPKPTDSGAGDAALVPNDGEWDVTIAEQWSGDCVLEDPDNGYPAETVWVLDVRREAVVLYFDYWELHPCTLDDGALLCLLDGTGTTGGTGWTATIAEQLSGTFADETRFEGAFTLDLSCEGDRCDGREVASAFGPDFAFPCAASAAVTGRWRAAVSER